MFKSILVPIDLSDPGHYRDALAAARSLAEQGGGALRLLTVVQGLSSVMAEYLPENTQDRIIAEAKTLLDEIATEIGMEGRVHTVVREGATHHEVLEEARDAGCDLIVMGSHQPGFTTDFTGAHAATVVRHAPCSVLGLRGAE